MTDTDNPTYGAVAALIEQAEALADRRAGDDPFSPWARVAASVTVARFERPPTARVEPPTTLCCSKLLREALDRIDSVPGEQRRPSHSLDRAYLATALVRAEDVEA